MNPGSSPLRTLLPHLWPRNAPELRLRIVAALACLTLAKVFTVQVPILFRETLDALNPDTGAALAVPIGLILAYGAARILALLFEQARDAIFAKVGQRAVRLLALRVFRHLHTLPLAFHLSRRTGGVARAIERGVKAIETLLRFTLFSVLPTTIEITLTFAILWSLLDLSFALVVMATVACYLIYTTVVTEWRTVHRRRMNEEDGRAHSRAVDSLLNFETVKYFAAEHHEAGRFDGAMRRYERAAVLSQTSLALLNVGQAAIVAVGVTAVMYMSAAGIADGDLSLGDFVLVNAYLLQLYQPLGFIGFVYREIKQALVDMERMFSLLRIAPEVRDRPDARALRIAGGEVAFEGGSFGYDPRRPVLKDITFRIGAGRTLAVVGPSGSGKSTLARLLFRFWDTDDGRILIDGQDIRDITQDSLRRAVGIVPQDTVLFNDTILYNIAYGRPDAAPADIRRAADLAEISGLVDGLPDGWETGVGERGLKLSGGEKQRISIARTLLKDPPILVLDEATSSLDTHTEQAIQSNLETLSRGRTALVIAHRLSTVVQADEILVLDRGRIVERGHHGALLAAGGRYAAMWSAQMEAEAE